jgi:predicted PurR-regulated permease PerM
MIGSLESRIWPPTSEIGTLQEVRLVISPLVMTIVIAFGLWILFLVLAQALWVLILVVLAMILAAALGPPVRFMRRLRLPPRGWRIPKALAVIIIYLVIVLAIGAMFILVGAQLFNELTTFLGTLPDQAAFLADQLQELEDELGIPGLVPSTEQIRAQVQEMAAQALQAVQVAAVAVAALVEFVFRLVIVLMLALFMVIESNRILAFWLSLFPRSQRGKVRDVTTNVGDKVGRWAIGQLTVASLAGILAGVGAAIIGLPYPVLIGVAAFFLDLAPVVGPLLLVIPGVLLGLTQSPLIAVIAAVYFVGMAEFLGNVASPLIVGRAVEMSPTIIIIAVPLGLALYGAIGALIAIPIATALQIIFQEVVHPWLKARNGEATSATHDSDQIRQAVIGSGQRE